MVVFPNAKINLGLHILRKRADGYHDLDSCFVPVPLTDTLEAVPGTELTFKIYGAGVPGAIDDNLVIKAYRLLAGDFRLPPLNIHLLKTLPMGAGMGGGSADAAFMLKLINNLCKLNLSNEVLTGYARRLGSDCAFFIHNKPAIASEKGDVLESFTPDLQGLSLVIVHPGIHVSTAEAYAGVQPRERQKTVKEVLSGPRSQWKTELVNDFENSVFAKYPGIAAVKQTLYDAGALYASMTGSGSAVYALFEGTVPDHLPVQFKDVYFRVCTPEVSLV